MGISEPPLCYNQEIMAMIDPTKYPRHNGEPTPQHDLGRAATCPQLLDLAGYIDGLLVDDDAGRIELHLASCPVCLAMVRELIEANREQHDSSMTFVPGAVLAAAMNLVAASEIEHGAETGRGRDEGVRRFARWVPIARRAAAPGVAAAALALCAIGHHIGATLSSRSTTTQNVSSAQDSAADTSGALASNLTFGLLDESSDSNSSEIFNMALSQEVLQ
jgi:anti-sigma factor RsiW